MNTRETSDELVAAAQASCRQSYSPYSSLRVGAALRSARGAIYRGTNVENAAYPLGCCAEVSAITAGVQAEGREFRIAEVAVWAIGADGRPAAASPCGGCRQSIREFAVDGSVRIHYPWTGGELRHATLDELLPHSFVLPRGPGAG